MRSSSDIIVIGGGIIGGSIAYRLAQHGGRVIVIERGLLGEEASKAAAGMLAPQAEAAHGLLDPMTKLCYASHALYPEFVAELEEASGIRIGYQTTGSIYLASDFKEAQVLAGLLERQLQTGKPAEEISPQQLQEMEPALTKQIEAALYLPNDHHVDNRQLMKALVAAASLRGVEFVTGTPVLGVEFQDERAVGVRVPGQTIYGDTIINAAGCWAGLVDSGARLQLPVRPIRGQMVCLEKQPQPLHHLIHSSGCYLVPWPDGRILVGSTLENVGYNKDVTAKGVHQLLDAAIKIVPTLADAAIREVWAGLRPDTPDNLPILGATEISNLLFATGHFRNGILLAPITAKLIAELAVNGQPSISLEPFRPQRFDK